MNSSEVSIDERNLDRVSQNPCNQVLSRVLITLQDLCLLISEYLHTRPHPALARAFDEELLGLGHSADIESECREVESAILDGEFGLLENLVLRPGLLRHQTQRAFIYVCYRQQFLEHIDNREVQKAFNLLQKRLKPLEHYQPFPYDFYNLCYLTSAGTVHDAPGLREWGGPGPEREKLVGMWRDLLESGEGQASTSTDGPVAPKGRLVHLMRQAVAWQVEHTRHRGHGPWTVTSLLKDYQTQSIPDHLRLRVTGHTANVKCVSYIGGDEPLAVSGSSDSTLRVFSTDDGSLRHILQGHTSRIWDCAASLDSSDGDSGGSNHVASASGDGTLRVWSVRSGECRTVLDSDSGDVYGVRWRPGRQVSHHWLSLQETYNDNLTLVAESARRCLL